MSQPIRPFTPPAPPARKWSVRAAALSAISRRALVQQEYYRALDADPEAPARVEALLRAD